MGLSHDAETTTGDKDLINARLNGYATLEKTIAEIRKMLVQKRNDDTNAAYYKWLDDELNALDKRLHACVAVTKKTIDITSPENLDDLISQKTALSFLNHPPVYHLGNTYDELVICNPTAYSKDTYHSIMWGMLNGLRGTFLSALLGVIIGVLILAACCTPPVAGAVIALYMAIPSVCFLAGFIAFGAVEGYKASTLLQKGEVDDLSPVHLKALNNNSLINRFGLFKKDELEPLNAHRLEHFPVLPDM